jgi:hypothetical protein
LHHDLSQTAPRVFFEEIISIYSIEDVDTKGLPVNTSSLLAASQRDWSMGGV